MKWGLFLLALPELTAQIQVATVSPSGAETPVGGFVDLGSAYAGDILDTRFRIRNVGATATVVQPLRLAGVAFTLVGEPTLAQTLTPNANLDFWVRFQPPAFGAYSATLQVNDRMVLLRATAPPGASVYVSRGESFELLSNARTVDLGRFENNVAAEVPFRLRNETSSPLPVSPVRVGGFGFSLSTPIPPLVLTPGETFPFTVRVYSNRSVQIDGSLDVGGRSFHLQGQVVEPPIPPAELTAGNGPWASGQQVKVKLKLASPARGTGTALLRVEFQPAAGLSDDRAIFLLPGGERSARLTIAAGDTEKEVTLQTGTTAGEITLRLELPPQSQQLLLPLAAAIPRLDTARFERLTPGVVLTVNGFDNTRTVSQVAYTFYDRAGRALAPEMRLNAADLFRDYFRDSGWGGLFSLRAVFPVTGDAAQIGGAQVEVVNTLGATRLERVTAP